MKVYVVMELDYESSTVDAVFSTRERAEAYLAQFRDPEPDDLIIEEHEVDEAGLIRPELRPFRVLVVDGIVDRVDRVIRSRGTPRPGHCYMGWLDADTFAVVVKCWARDEDHAKEIATAKRAAFLEEQTADQKAGRR